MEFIKDTAMKRKIYDAAIIGAGASGLMAAITAARRGRDVILLEHMDQAGKKILSTGNGKCNYTNLNQSEDAYYCEDPAFVHTVLSRFSCADTIRFFEELGIRPLQKNGSCIYPESEQALSVKNVLTAEVKRLKIPLLLSAGIRSIQKQNSKTANRIQDIFVIQTKGQPLYCRNCILATGGMAAKKTGSDGSGYLYAKQLGHTVTKTLPALTALKADYSKWKLPAGVRTGCLASLVINDKPAASERGELQITDYGISGIVIFQFSRIAVRALADRKKVQVFLDFKPDMSEKELEAYLKIRFSSVYIAQKEINEGMTGFLPDKLSAVILSQSGISLDKRCGALNSIQIQNLVRCLKENRVSITGYKDFDFAQVTAGGVPLSQIHADTMESRLVKGLYFAGEIADADAKCGGYNLQWAWASGYISGRSIEAYDSDSADKSSIKTHKR